MQESQNKEKIAVFGLGYVGCVSAACLAALGHRVIGVDKDQHKADHVSRGEAPFYEPGLAEAVREAVASGLLTATTSTAAALEDASIALICVGTPSERNGNLGVEQLRRVMTEISAELSRSPRELIVAVRSTVFPGTCEELAREYLSAHADVAVVSNPEFLREGIAIRDFMEPSLIVVGGDNAAAVERVANVYASLGVAACRVSLRTAEMIKYACNSFHAVKIAFANEVGALAGKLGVDGEEVMETLCQDTRLNISAAYLRPGFAFGGSCLPKDLRALVHRAGRLDLKLPLLESALPSNAEHLQRAIESVLELPARRLGFVGLAFKENTDDLRESPVITMLENLIGKGRDIRVFDPHIRLDSIYGANREYLLRALPHISRLLANDVTEVLDWAEYVVVAQKTTPGLAEKIRECGRPVLDVFDGRLTKPVAATSAV